MSSVTSPAAKTPGTEVTVELPPVMSEDQCRMPADMPLTRVRHEIGKRIDRDRDGAGADRQMRVRHPYDIEQ